ncbi:hypothetical protein BGZ75_001621 [Mortierella antarctica]|nr:hypothetical protein BGZ75_001621 [Mortierella antarctica]
MVSLYNSRRPRLVLLLGTALYLQGTILPTTLAAKSYIDTTSSVVQTTNSQVKGDQELRQGQQHISNLQQDSQAVVATAHKSKGKNKKADKKARESALDAKDTKAHNHQKNADEDAGNGSDDSDDNTDNDEGSGDDGVDISNKKKNDVNSYLADLWKGIVHLGEEPNIQAGIAALTSRIHGVTKHHGKRDVIQRQQQPLSEMKQGRQYKGGALEAPAVGPLLLHPNHHWVQKDIKKKTVEMAEGVEGLAHPDKSGGKTGVNKGNENDNAGGRDNEDSDYYDDDHNDEGGFKKSNLPKIGQRVVFGKDGQVVGLAVDVGPGHPTGHGVSESERFVKYGNEIISAGESMMTGHDLAEALTPAPHPFLVLEKRQRLGMLGANAVRGDAGVATATMAMAKQPQPQPQALEMDMGLKRVRPAQEPEIDRAMDGAVNGDPQRKDRKDRKDKKDKGQEPDAGVQEYEKIAKKLRKQNDDALQALPAEEKKDKKADALQKAVDKMFGGEDAKDRKKNQADPFEVDVPKRHRNKDKAVDGLDNIPIEVQKEKKERHESKHDKDVGGGEPAHKDQGPGNGDMGKPNDKDAGKTKQEPPAGAVLDPGKGAAPNQANHPPDRTGPAPVSGNKKDSTAPGGFGTVPMFGPAQLDLGSGATVSTVLSTWTRAFVLAAALMVTLVNC